MLRPRSGKVADLLPPCVLAWRRRHPAVSRATSREDPLVSGRHRLPDPIGNLEDVTLRVLSALRDADVVACEDTRRTRVLLDRYGVDATLVSYHEHNERARAAELVARMTDGAVVALVSDAGMPLVSDPGYVLVQGCVGAGLAVEVLPGPSAALAALVASALPADRWRFVGFLPRKASELSEVFASPETVVAFEAPGRVAASLRVARGARSLAGGGRVPGAHQAARGDRARPRGGARGAIRAAGAAGRGGARGGRSGGHRRGRRHGRCGRRARASSSRRARSRARRPVWWRSSQGSRPTPCTAPGRRRARSAADDVVPDIHGERRRAHRANRPAG